VNTKQCGATLAVNSAPKEGNMSQTFNGNGGSERVLNLLEPQPDLQQALEEAIDISARRGTSLTRAVAQAATSAVKNGGGNGGAATANAANGGASNGVAAASESVASELAANGSAAAPPSGAKNGFRSTPVPHPSALPPEMLAGVRHVDIMASLEPLGPVMKSVEKEIERLITTPVKLVADIAGHVLGAGGKRLRPALTLLSAQICGDNSEAPSPRAVTCAALVELTHTTTLLHDDVVDGATTRRGRPAANLIWGNETSVLVGDYLFAQVFVAASRRGIAELMHPLAHATAQMCAGELLETQMRGFWEMSEKQYLEIVALKTGSLTECACRMGALAIEANERQVEALGTFGRSIGVAFQIVDDVFDVISTEEGIGKPVGNDLREGAITLPMLWVLKNSPDAAEFQEILSHEEKSDEDVKRAIEIMRDGQAVASSLSLAREYAEAAKNCLEIFPEGAARNMLCDIADYVLSREK
jgi:geranylgeranyl pyrophosphate synthase